MERARENLIATTGPVQAGQRRTTSSRDDLLRAGAELLARNPRATLDEIARAANVGRATLHRHFTSRADLLRQIGLGALMTMEAAIKAAKLGAESPEKALHSLMDVLIPHGAHAHFLLYAAELYDDTELKLADERINGLIYPVILRARQAGVIRPDVPDAWVFASLEALLYAAWSAVHKGAVARNDASRLLLASFLHGVGTADRGRSGNE